MFQKNIIPDLKRKMSLRRTTDLMVAVSSQDLPSIRRYLDQAEINVQNEDGYTALHYAVDMPQVLEMLLEKGADPMIADDLGYRPYDYIAQYAQSDPKYQEIKDRIDSNLSLFDRIQLYVWDFDCTITGIHSCGNELLFSENVELRRVIADLDLFKQVIKRLRELGKEVAIASYGRKEIILQTMKKIFGDENPFNESNVVTPQSITITPGRRWLDCHLPPAGFDKNDMLQLLQKRYRDNGQDFKNDQIILFDDTAENVDRAISQGYLGIKIPKAGCKGFNRNLNQVFPDLLTHEDEFANLWSRYLKS
jgi:hypothetical protein